MLKTIQAANLASLIKEANKENVTKDEIVGIHKIDFNQYILIYYREK